MDEKRQNRRIPKEFTPEERQRWIKARDAALAEKPQLIAKGKRLHEARMEPTFSGALRDRVHRCEKDITKIAQEAGLTLDQLDGFLTGDQTLRNDVVDRLVEVVGFVYPPASSPISPILAPSEPIIQTTTPSGT